MGVGAWATPRDGCACCCAVNPLRRPRLECTSHPHLSHAHKDSNRACQCLQDAVTRNGKFLTLYKRAGHRVLINPRGDCVVRPNFVEQFVHRAPGGERDVCVWGGGGRVVLCRRK